MSVRRCAVEGGAVVTCVDDQKIVSANTREADTEFNVVWILKLQHVFSKKLSGLISVALLYEPHIMMGYFYRSARMYARRHARTHALSLTLWFQPHHRQSMSRFE